MNSGNISSHPLRVAIVGGGPRGLVAVEALAGHMSDREMAVTLFEPHEAPGAGPNYVPDQTPLNLLNIALRALYLPAPERGEAFETWLDGRYGPNDYPPRAVIGAYLHARFADLHERRAVEVIGRAVTGCERAKGGWLLRTDEGSDHGPFDEVLLCPGHQPVRDRQIERWRKHAAGADAILCEAYPTAALLAATEWQGRTVAIRGFGLAMIDATRALTEGLGGRFETEADGRLIYSASGREPARLMPFSLNGIPPAPKPATAAIDRPYVVEERERLAFREAVSSLVEVGDGDLEPIFGVVADIAGAKLPTHGRDAVLAWLRDGAGDDPDVPDDEQPEEAMTLYLAMARGEAAPSVGYVTGQVWRHLQNDLRIAYNPAPKTAAVAEALIPFDEGMKRFSYGPPAEATARLLALIAAGKLTLRRVDDPDIELVDGGWRMAETGGADIATAMVDSVLAGPDIAKVSSPLMAGLRERGFVSQLGKGLGASVRPDGRIIDANSEPVEGLSLLGRLANGSVIATDSLHDCFGEAVRRWARRVAGEC